MYNGANSTYTQQEIVHIISTVNPSCATWATQLVSHHTIWTHFKINIHVGYVSQTHLKYQAHLRIYKATEYGKVKPRNNNSLIMTTGIGSAFEKGELTYGELINSERSKVPIPNDVTGW